MEKTVDNYGKSGPFNWSELSRSTEVGDGQMTMKSHLCGKQSVEDSNLSIRQYTWSTNCMSDTYCVQEL